MIDEQVKKSFGYKWEQFHEACYNPVEMQRLEKEFKEYFEVDNFNFKKVLDVGCGPCRYYPFFPETTEYYGVDLSSAANIGKERFGTNKNFHVLQGDMMDLPYEKNSFDLIIGIGSLHHTPDTEKAFKYVSQFLAEGGLFCSYIYTKKAPLREYLDDKIREQTTKMSEEDCIEFSKIMTNVGRELSKSKVTIDGMPLQRYIYWNAFKCFWNEETGHDYSLAVNFDWYHPKYAFRHTAEEIKQWAEDVGLKVLNINSAPAAHWVKCTK